jgi:hypothetical protein
VSVAPEDAKRLVSDDERWISVEREAKALLAGIAGGNLLRRQKMQLVAAQAFTIAATLARGSEGRPLLPFVESIRRLRAARRKRADARG